MGDQTAVDQHIHRFAGQAIEFDHRTLCQLQQILDRNLGAPQFDRQLHWNIEDEIDVVVGLGLVAVAGEVLEYRSAGSLTLRGGGFRLGFLGAAEFLPFAEESGLIIPISDWMLEAICNDFLAWKEIGGEQLCLSLNVSPQYLDRGDFFDKLQNALARHKIPPSQMEVEVTENICIRNPQVAIEQLENLCQLGVSVAIDDFGNVWVTQCALTSFKKGVNGKKGLKEIFKDDDGKYYFLGGASTKEKEIWKGVTLNADGSSYEEGGADKIVEKGPVAAAGWSEFKVVNAFKSGGVMPIRIFPTVLGFKEVHATTNRNNGEYPSFHVKFDVGTGVPGTTAGYISCFYKYPSGNFANYGQNEADRKKIIAFVTKNNSGEKFSEVMSALRKEADSIAGILMNSLK